MKTRLCAVLVPTLNGLVREGAPYGRSDMGLMLTEISPKLLNITYVLVIPNVSH